MLSNEKIRDAVEKAFRLLRCVAEISDYDQKLRFRVFDDRHQGIVRVPSLVL